MVKQILSGSILLVGRSLIEKFLGMLSTLVLARLLVPEDFGLIALATLALGLLDVFGATGGGQYVLRASEVDDDLINSAWTLNLALKTALALVLVLLSPLISRAYSTPELEPVLWAFAALLVLQSVRNPGTLLLQREQRFQKIVAVSLLAKVVSALVAVSLALLGAAHWALVAGRVVMSLVELVGSYVIHQYRPKICTTQIRNQTQFSAWLILQGVLGYSRNNLDTFLVSSTFGTAQLGSFHTMKYLAYIPSAHLLLPATQPLLRELSKHRENHDYFSLQHNVAFLAGACLALPIASVIAATAPELIAVFLGKNWVQYSDLFRWFALLIPAYFFFQHSIRTCIVFGQTRLTFIYEVFALIFVFTPVLVIGIDDIVAFTLLRVELELAATVLFLCFTTLHFTNLRSLIALLIGVIPLVVSCLLATAVSTALIITEAPLIKLILFSIVWAVVFATTFLILILGVWKRQREWAYLILKGKDGTAFAKKLVRGKLQKKSLG